MPRSELGDFLRSRRAAVTPHEAGLVSAGHRRVPGLRREEVSQLVGVSTDYYTRLEQGRGAHPSPSVIDAIARVLSLTSAQRTHLVDLAGLNSLPAVRPRRPTIPAPAPHLLRLLGQLDVPAMVMTRYVQVVGWNPLCARLLAPFDDLAVSERNMARLVFGDSDLAARHRDWDVAARDIVGILRMTAGQDPNSVLLQELIGELAVYSATFRRLWAEHHVHEKTSGPKPLRHPEVGDIDLHYDTFAVAGDPSLMLVTYSVAPGTPSSDALALRRTLLPNDGRTVDDSTPNATATNPGPVTSGRQPLAGTPGSTISIARQGLNEAPVAVAVTCSDGRGARDEDVQSEVSVVPERTAETSLACF